MTRTIKCPNCDRKFGDAGAVCQHIKSKHGGKRISAFRAENQPGYEPSFADLAVQASIDRAMGVENDDDWLLP